MGNGKLLLILLVLVILYRLTRPGPKNAGTVPRPRKGAVKVLSHIPAKPTAESTVLAEWLLQKAAQQTGVDLIGDEIARKRIDEAAASVLPMIREHGEMEVNLPLLTADATGARDFTIMVSRDTLHSLGLQ